jgi:hypothetical protein
MKDKNNKLETIFAVGWIVVILGVVFGIISSERRGARGDGCDVFHNEADIMRAIEGTCPTEP